MRRYITFIIFTLYSIHSAFGQGFTISGKVLDDKTKEPIEYANIVLPVNDLWAISNKDGSFTFKQVPLGRTTVVVSCMGYVTRELSIDVRNDIPNLKLSLSPDNLGLKEVVVTAQRKTSDATTTYMLDRTTIDHLQILDVADISSLLPGGETLRRNSLADADSESFALRSGAASEQGNASMGTAVEVDGVRLSNNGGMGSSNLSYFSAKGTETRSISSSNIGSIEIITGVPSVEYGDLTNGVVKINTIKGRAPFTAEFVTKPNEKQYTLGKGLMLGKKGGILNLHLEHTKSVSEISSPYTSYKRNIASMAYTNTLNRESEHPIILKAGFTGNIGGYDSKSDPDNYADTYKKQKDNILRGHVDVNWLLNKTWITKLEASVSVNYNDRHWKENTYKSTAAPIPAMHATEEGYYLGQSDNLHPGIVLIPAGKWYELKHDDSKEITYTGKLKASWAHKINNLNNRFMIGADVSRSGNNGRGMYYDDMSTAPDWREYRYKDLPYLDNLALYAEEQINIPIQKTNLQLTAGVRSDVTSISGSEYGTVSSISPRFNMKYNIPFRRGMFFKNVVVRAGLGEAVKLPSFYVLYPRPAYKDVQTFAPGSLADGTAHYAYYVQPTKAEHNPNLKWQKERLREIGVDLDMKWVKVSLSYFDNKTINPYASQNNYSPITYNFTSPTAMDAVVIPTADRVYSVDKTTGIVTVSDKTGNLPNQQLAYSEKNTFKSNNMRSNASPVKRRGLEWVVDFAKIQALQTSFRVDGKYYYYKGVDETLYASLGSSSNMADGNPYKYIGYYVGDVNSTSNGSIAKKLNTNLTITTHIPKVKLIVSVRIESSLYNYKQNLSEYNGKAYAFVLDSRDDYFPSGTKKNIYAGDQYTGAYPLYYVSHDDMNTKIPFTEEHLRDAKENNPMLYNELVKMINRSNHNYTFNPNKISAYFTANISVTKEIGKYASLTFHARNFFNNTGKVRSSWSNADINLYENTNYAPSFYYGLSLRVKI